MAALGAGAALDKELLLLKYPALHFGAVVSTAKGFYASPACPHVGTHWLSMPRAGGSSEQLLTEGSIVSVLSRDHHTVTGG